MEDKDIWKNADDAFGCLAGSIKECMDKGLIRFNDLWLASLSIWAMGHGLVSLNISCRMKVLNMDDCQIQDSIYVSVKNYLELLRK